MPKFIRGNIWESRKDKMSWIAITTNSFIKNDGSLAMGAGIAKQALAYYPNLDKILGEKIVKVCKPLAFYGVVSVPQYQLVAIQTKYHFKDNSTIELIKRSIAKLTEFIDILKMQNLDYIDKEVIIHIPFPGIGFGGLNPKQVYENCLLNLADNYKVWTKN